MSYPFIVGHPLARISAIAAAAYVNGCNGPPTCAHPKVVHHEVETLWLPVSTDPPVIAPIEQKAWDEPICPSISNNSGKA